MGAFTSSTTRWSIPFLESSEFRERLGEEGVTTAPWALVILNTPVSRELLDLAWNFCAASCLNTYGGFLTLNYQVVSAIAPTEARIDFSTYLMKKIELRESHESTGS